MEFHVLELPKLPEKLKEDNDNILLWAKFINAERKEDFDMLAEKDPYIGSAYQQLQIISQDKQKRLEYEAREKAIRDHNQLLFEAEQRGEQRGELRGEQRGEQRGIKLGEARINQLHMLLLQQKRYDDLERSVNDINYQQQLLKEYGI